MRFKYYLRGCGLGILLTTIVLTVGFHRRGTAELSDWEIIQRASKLGMVMEDSEGTEMSEAAQGSSEPEPSEALPQNAGEEPPKEDRNEEPPRKQEDPGNSGREDTPGIGANSQPPVTVEQEDGSVVLVVKEGDVCRDIAAELYRTKIVKDAEDFRRFMGRNGYSSQIRNGTYTFTREMEYEQIAEILTNK